MINISLEGKVALVTGAGDGIGKGCAMTLAEAGANVVINDINATTGQAVAEQIQNMGREAMFIKADVTEPVQVQAMVDAIAQRFGALHILVNNAGDNLFKGLADTEPHEWDRIMNLDLRGLYLVTRACLPLLKAAGGASIVNIASVHAQATLGNITAYAAAKGGVVSLTRSLNQELGPFGIRVNAISPGFVMTPLLQRWLEGEPDPAASMARVNAMHPLGYIAEPADIGQLAAFLCSPLARCITGANVTIDGGLTTQLKH
jgi:NAD(P)-dependent dehydrogenase (short-subunit alcohol dehydrogenase family)